MKPVRIKIELFGVPRLRAGVAEFFVDLDDTEPTIRNVLKQVRNRFPQLGPECFSGSQLRPEYMISISGKRFTRDMEETLNESDSLLILSSDAGG